MSVMKLYTHFFEDGIETKLTGVNPSFLLSLDLVVLNAQNHESKTAGSRWHMSFYQFCGDEVKGFYPLVYEDIESEAIFVVFFVVFLVVAHP